MAGGAPPRLLGASRVVLDDLRQASGADAALTFARAPEDDEAASKNDQAWRIVATFTDGTAAGFEVLVGESNALLVAIADGLQQAFIEQLGAAVPHCPGHPHPLHAALRGERAAWVCPSTDECRYPIGEYRRD